MQGPGTSEAATMKPTWAAPAVTRRESRGASRWLRTSRCLLRGDGAAGRRRAASGHLMSLSEYCNRADTERIHWEGKLCSQKEKTKKKPPFSKRNISQFQARYHLGFHLRFRRLALRPPSPAPSRQSTTTLLQQKRGRGGWMRRHRSELSASGSHLEGHQSP